MNGRRALLMLAMSGALLHVDVPAEAERERRKCRHGVWLTDRCYDCVPPAPPPALPLFVGNPSFAAPPREPSAKEIAAAERNARKAAKRIANAKKQRAGLEAMQQELEEVRRG